jgi:hypothetical protein
MDHHYPTKHHELYIPQQDHYEQNQLQIEDLPEEKKIR